MADMGSRTDNALARAQAALEDEHGKLGGLVGKLREARDPVAVTAILDELHAQLKAHFEHEEFPGGLYESMGALGPRYADQIRDLVDQHFMLLAMVRGLADQARRAAAPAGAAILRDAAAIADQLRTHESKEHRLVEQIQAGQ